MKNNLMKMLLTVCAFSAMIVPACAANVDSAEPPAPESEAIVATQTEDNGIIMPKGDTYFSVKYNNVNIRSGAGTNYASYGMIHKGQLVLWDSHSIKDPGVVSGNGYKWIQVIVYNGVNAGVQGWVAMNNLEEVHF